MSRRFRSIVKQWVEALPPHLGSVVFGMVRYLSIEGVRERRRRESRISRALGAPHHVLQGPFAGMRYITRAQGSESLPKILGTYELELRSAIEAICAYGADTIINIGAAEGYYAIGLAMRNPAARVICFEMFRPAHFLFKKMRSANGMDGRIELHGECDNAALKASLARATRAVIVCDCEGAEDLLLDPAAVPELARAVVLVETHDQFCPGVSGRLRARFGNTHELQTIVEVKRTFGDLPPCVGITEEQARQAMDETREGQGAWLYMVPRRLA